MSKFLFILIVLIGITSCSASETSIIGKWSYIESDDYEGRSEEIEFLQTGQLLKGQGGSFGEKWFTLKKDSIQVTTIRFNFDGPNGPGLDTFIHPCSFYAIDNDILTIIADADTLLLKRIQ